MPPLSKQDGATCPSRFTPESFISRWRDPRDAGGLATGYQCSIRGTLTVAPLGRLRHPLQLVADVRPASYFPSVENSLHLGLEHRQRHPEGFARAVSEVLVHALVEERMRVSTKPAFLPRRPTPFSPPPFASFPASRAACDHLADASLRPFAEGDALAHQAALSLALGAARDAARGATRWHRVWSETAPSQCRPPGERSIASVAGCAGAIPPSRCGRPRR